MTRDRTRNEPQLTSELLRQFIPRKRVESEREIECELTRGPAGPRGKSRRGPIRALRIRGVPRGLI